MLRHSFTILIIAITTTVQGQSLKNIEKRLSLLIDIPEFGQLDKIRYDTTGLSKLPPLDFFCDDENENIWDYYHVIDLNNDGQKDLIYNGPCIPYSEASIFLNKGDRLDLVHTYPGEILSIEQMADKSIIQILKWPCCCDISFEYYEVTIYNDSRVDKNVITFDYKTKITLNKLKEIKVSGIVRTTEELNDNEEKESCQDKVVKGNHLIIIDNPTKVIQLNQHKDWRLILYSEDKTKSWIGWIKLQ